VVESGAAGLGQLAYDATNVSISHLTQNVAPKDAVIKVDGVTITKSSNTISDAIQGVTLNLTKAMASNSTATLSLSNDTSSVSTAINTFVQAYNAVTKQINDATAYDPTTKKEVC